MSRTKILVCVTCRKAEEPLQPREQRAGARLFAQLAAAQSEFELVPVECLSVCKRPVTISFAAAGKWTYLYGDLLPETSIETILTGARLYSATPDGLIAWKQRPDALKKGVIARLPPHTYDHLTEGTEP